MFQSKPEQINTYDDLLLPQHLDKKIYVTEQAFVTFIKSHEYDPHEERFNKTMVFYTYQEEGKPEFVRKIHK